MDDYSDYFSMDDYDIDSDNDNDNDNDDQEVAVRSKESDQMIKKERENVASYEEFLKKKQDSLCWNIHSTFDYSGWKKALLGPHGSGIQEVEVSIRVFTFGISSPQVVSFLDALGGPALPSLRVLKFYKSNMLARFPIAALTRIFQAQRNKRQRGSSLLEYVHLQDLELSGSKKDFKALAESLLHLQLIGELGGCWLKKWTIAHCRLQSDGIVTSSSSYDSCLDPLLRSFSHIPTMEELILSATRVGSLGNLSSESLGELLLGRQPMNSWGHRRNNNNNNNNTSIAMKHGWKELRLLNFEMSDDNLAFLALSLSDPTNHHATFSSSSRTSNQSLSSSASSSTLVDPNLTRIPTATPSLKHNSLQKLVLSFCRFGESSCAAMDELIRTNKSLEELEIHLATTSTRVPAYYNNNSSSSSRSNDLSLLEEFDDKRKQELIMIEQFLSMLANALKHNTTLIKLDIRQQRAGIPKCGPVTTSSSSLSSVANPARTNSNKTKSSNSLQLDEFVELLQNDNFRLEQLQFQLDQEDFPWLSKRREMELDFYLSLNRAGRRHIMGPDAGHHRDQRWLEVLLSVQHDLDSLFYFLSRNPSMISE